MTDTQKLTPCPTRPDLAAFGVPHPEPFVCQIEIDPATLSRAVPHVSNIEYVRWLDRAAELHSDSLGHTRQAMLDRGVMWFVARHEIDYLAEAWQGDRLVIATWVRDFRKVKSWRDYVIARLDDNAVICRASTLWVLVDLRSRRPIRVPREMIDRFAPLSAAASDDAVSR